ncbi:MAG: flagellar hook-basal body complex protein FliE [Candidatus Latescibacterota bacterium]|nr:MAG: flagellar hook-basal body complex protein FliE [Candidatus Latescibacterota bacterium]
MSVQPVGEVPLSNVEGKRPSGKGFGELVKNFIAEVDALQKKADMAASQLVTGEAENLHQVMLAVERASLALSLMVEVRNKVLEAYREVMRMQM